MNDVDRSVHVFCTLARLRNWQVVVALDVCPGSNRLNAANTPGSCETVTVWPPIVTVSERATPLFAAAVMTTLPLPVALAVAVRNDELVDAVQPQVDAAVTATLAVPPPLLILTAVVERVTVQPTGASAPDCVKLTTLPPIEMLADRAAPVFAATLYATDPLPLPDAPELIVRKLALLTAVHAQPVAAVTGIVPVVAAALRPVVTEPTVIAHAAADGAAVELFEHAAAASATAADARKASSRRGYLIRPAF